MKKSDEEIRKMIYQDMPAGKEKLWKSEKVCLTP